MIFESFLIFYLLECLVLITAYVLYYKEPKKIETPKIEVPKEVLSATPKAKIIKQELPKLVVKDGGSF